MLYQSSRSSQPTFLQIFFLFLVFFSLSLIFFILLSDIVSACRYQLSAVNSSSPVEMLDHLSKRGSEPINDQLNSQVVPRSCVVSGTQQVLDRGMWTTVQNSSIFSVHKTKNYSYFELKVSCFFFNFFFLSFFFM